MPSLFVNIAKICFWRCSRTRTKKTKTKTPSKTTKNRQNLSIFAHLPVNTPISGVHEQKMSVDTPKNGGGFREHKFHWGGRSSRPTDRPTRVCASSRRWCEYHRPVVLFVRFSSVAQPQAKHRGRFAHCSCPVWVCVVWGVRVASGFAIHIRMDLRRPRGTLRAIQPVVCVCFRIDVRIDAGRSRR